MLYISRKKEHGGDRKTEESIAQNEQLKTDTAELIAQQTGVSRATIVRDAAYAEACDHRPVDTIRFVSC
jgi:NACalpha-BTF3-like transcription factor